MLYNGAGAGAVGLRRATCSTDRPVGRDRLSGCSDDPGLLGPAEIRGSRRRSASGRPRRSGQNFVIDANTVRRIVRLAGVGAGRRRPRGRSRPRVADPGPARRGRPGRRRRDRPACWPPRCRDTVAERAPATGRPARRWSTADALRLAALPGPPPTALVANLPYNVAVPVAAAPARALPALRRGAGDGAGRGRRPAGRRPGRRAYGVPSVKAAWYADGAAGRQRRPHRVLARAQRRLRPGRVRPPRAAARPRRPGQAVFAVRRRGVRPAAQDPARRAGRLGRARRPRPRRRCAPPGSTRARAGSSSTSSSSPRSPTRSPGAAAASGGPTDRPSRSRSPRHRPRAGQGQPRAARSGPPRPTATTSWRPCSTPSRSTTRSRSRRPRPTTASRHGRGRRRRRRPAGRRQPGRPRGRAARRARRRRRRRHLHIAKGIPVAGGMAGGRADAAAALVACDALWRTGLDPRRLPARRRAGQRRAVRAHRRHGDRHRRGEQLTPALARGEYHWVFAFATAGCRRPRSTPSSTGSAAGRAVLEPRGADPLMQALRRGDAAALGARSPTTCRRRPSRCARA